MRVPRYKYDTLYYRVFTDSERISYTLRIKKYLYKRPLYSYQVVVIKGVKVYTYEERCPAPYSFDTAKQALYIKFNELRQKQIDFPASLQ